MRMILCSGMRMKKLTLTPILEIGDDESHPIPRSSDYEAWCSSKKCAGDRYQVVLVKVEAKDKDIFCSNCGYALIWKRKC